MKTVNNVNLSTAAVDLARALCAEAGCDTMTDETWPTADNQLWSDLTDEEIANLNNAAKGDPGALVHCRVAWNLPVFV